METIFEPLNQAILEVGSNFRIVKSNEPMNSLSLQASLGWDFCTVIKSVCLVFLVPALSPLGSMSTTSPLELPTLARLRLSTAHSPGWPAGH